jgi:DNA modification methylase
MVDRNDILNVAQALSSETRLNLIKTIGNKSLSLYEIKNQFGNSIQRESIYRALEKLSEVSILSKSYNKFKKRYEYSVKNPQISLKILDEQTEDEEKDGVVEKYPVYENVSNQLKNGSFIDIRDYKKLKDYSKFNKEIYKNGEAITSSKVTSVLKKVEWKQGEYSKQHWGNWLHSISPYVGRMTPALAHWLIKSSSKPGDVVLDPFCGIGTVCLEADLLGRKTIGIDLNPYAALIAKAKFGRKNIEEHLDFLRKVELDTSKIDLSKISPFIKQYFHDKTLKEILALKGILVKEKKEFLLACLMGILHGNRPGYLSAWTGCIIPMAPRKPNNPKFDPAKDIPEYRPVIPRLAAKVKRMYMNPFPIQTKGKIYEADSRNLSFLKDNCVDVICCSPPYYHTLDYVGANRLRLAILGFDEEGREEMKTTLIQQRQTYLEEMKKVGKELHRVMKPNSHILFVLGDVHMTKYSLNTAKDIGKLYEEVGFKMVDIVDDEIPRNKCAVQNGNHKKKLDRILILKTIK